MKNESGGPRRANGEGPQHLTSTFDDITAAVRLHLAYLLGCPRRQLLEWHSLLGQAALQRVQRRLYEDPRLRQRIAAFRRFADVFVHELEAECKTALGGAP